MKGIVLDISKLGFEFLLYSRRDVQDIYIVQNLLLANLQQAESEIILFRNLALRPESLGLCGMYYLEMKWTLSLYLRIYHV